MAKKAVLVGINYKNTDAQLNGCINDVKNIRAILETRYGYSNIRLLTDETDVKPTKKNIEDSIEWLVNGNVAGDTLVFYYSGHGSSLKDRTGEETDGNDEVIIPLDYTTKGVITDDWLYANLCCKIPAEANLWAFTDCCHSGTILDLKYNYQSNCVLKQGIVASGYNAAEWTDNYSFYVERTKDIVGNVVLFSGCQDKETSADAYLAKTNQGAFSYCFLDILKTSKVQNIKLRNILKEINCKLELNGFKTQNCQLSIGKQSDLEKTMLL